MNKAQAAGMERAGETGDIIDRRAGERRAAAPVVAVVAADLTDDAAHKMLESMHAHLEKWAESNIPDENDGSSNEDLVKISGECIRFLRAALASQAQAAVSAPVQRESWDLYGTGIKPWSHRIPPTQPAHIIADAMQEELNELRPLAAQAAVGVASQQEQQPQPSCNAALRAAPEGQHEAERLTTGDIQFLAHWDSVCDGYGFGTEFNTAFKAAEAAWNAARRFRAPGGNTNDKASPDLASIASQAQGEEK